MSDKLNGQWRLAARPEGDLKDTDLVWHEEPVRPSDDGELRVRNVYLSVDPTNRIWMTDVEQYMPPVQIGDVMRGAAIGVVEESNNPDFKVGDVVQGILGWQEYLVGDGTGLVKIPSGLPFPLTAYMGLLGHIGATAYFGLLEIGEPKEGETVVVSAAAGAVGSIVGQLAKLKGCRVVGIVGSDEKCKWLTEELGFDAAVNRRSANFRRELKAACPDGIDIDFENAGGEILDTILGLCNLKARVVLCGLISQYNVEGPPPGPKNFPLILMKRLRVEGFIIIDYQPRFMEAVMQLGQWLTQGKIKYRVDLSDGLKTAPDALRDLFAGNNIGKRLVKVSEES